MELRNIQTFLKIVELKHFTKAAESLGYAQSTVTTQIHQLEDELGHPLFDRVKNRVVLTDFGRIFLPLAIQMENINDEMHNLGTRPEEIKGHLKIGVIESCYYSNFLDVLTEYKKRFPLVDLELRTGSSAELCGLLAENSLDMVFCLKMPADYSKFEIPFIQTRRIGLFAAPDHPLARRSEISLADASQYPFIMTEEESVYHRLLHEIFFREGLSMKHSLTLQSTFAIKNLLQKLPGTIACLPEYAAQKETADGSLAKLNCPQLFAEVPVIAAVLKGKWHAPQVTEMLDLVSEMNKNTEQ